MRKYQWLVIVMLIGCIAAFASCRRMEQMMAPAMPEPEPPEVVEPPVETMPEVEMMPESEGIGIFDTNVMAGHGLEAEAFYPGVVLNQLPDFTTLTPFHTWTVANIDVPHIPYERGFPELGTEVLEHFAIRLRGQLKVETTGDYTFKIQSDDGAQVYINGELVVDNDGWNSFTVKYGSVMLEAGYHDVEIRYFQGPAHQIGLQWSWQPPGGVEAIVPPEVLYPPGTGTVAMKPMVETPPEMVPEMPPAIEGPIVSVSPAQIASPAVGEQLQVSIQIAQAADVVGYELTLGFDPAALKYVSGSLADYLPAGAFPVITPAANSVYIAGASTSGAASASSGTLATVTFEVIAAGASTLTFSEVVLFDSAGEITPTTADGEISAP